MGNTNTKKNNIEAFEEAGASTSMPFSPTFAPDQSTFAPDQFTTMPLFIDPNLPKVTEAPYTIPLQTTNKTGFQCLTDEDCKNPDSFSSTPGKNGKMVYSCPSATCSGGVCNCGSTCALDPYSGVCCQGLEKIGGEMYCVENTSQPLVTPTTNANEGIYWFIDEDQ